MRDMRVICNKALAAFVTVHRQADASLQSWRKLVEAGTFSSYGDLKKVFNTVDRVNDFYVFDIGGNKYRVISSIHFNRQMLFVRHVFTHKEYDRWKP